MVRYILFSVLVLFLQLGQYSVPGYSQPQSDQKKAATEHYTPSEGALDRGEAPVELVPGWRVQLVSVDTEAAAARFADSLQSLMNAEIQVLFRDNSYKIQAGNFLQRSYAEKFREKLRVSGFPDAWLVTARVRSGARDTSEVELRSPEIVVPQIVEKEPEEEQKKEDTPKLKPAPPETYQYINTDSDFSYEGSGNGWRIQIMSLFYMPRKHAEDEALNAQVQLDLSTYVFNSVKAHKVRVGDFLTREDAEKELKKIRNAGYPDAYLVKSNINLVEE